MAVSVAEIDRWVEFSRLCRTAGEKPNRFRVLDASSASAGEGQSLGEYYFGERMQQEESAKAPAELAAGGYTRSREGTEAEDRRRPRGESGFLDLHDPGNGKV